MADAALASDATILAEIKRFREAHGIAPTAFGRRAIGDANLIANLEAGRELRRATEARVRTFMRQFQSEQAAA